MKKKGARFLVQMLMHPRSVGAVWPSSDQAAAQMEKQIPGDTKLIVELGPGTGALTERFITARKHAQIVLIEINKVFAKTLQERFGGFPSVHIVADSAVNLPASLDRLGFGNPDVILCSIPFTTLPAHLSNEILQASVQALGSNGKFIAIQYSKSCKTLFERFFNSVSWLFEWENLPPTYVVVMKNEAQAETKQEKGKSI